MNRRTTQCWCVLAALPILLAGRSSKAQVVEQHRFGAAVYDTVLNPEDFALADIDGDGLIDVLVASHNFFLGLHRSRADGTLRPRLEFEIAQGASGIAVGDMNSDGALDAIVALSDQDTIQPVMNLGNGTLKAGQQHPTGIDPIEIAVGDLNGDGNLDCITANDDSQDASVILGNGDGTFQLAVHYNSGPQPVAVAIADLNGDAAPDFAVANRGNDSISVFMNFGDGTFMNPVEYDTPDSPNDLVIDDLGGDGSPDIIVSATGIVRFYFNDGTGGFPSDEDRSMQAPQCVTVADLNRDFRLDVLTGSGLNAVSVRLQISQTSVLLGGERLFSAAESPTAIDASDLNGDGYPDIIVAHRFPATISVLLGSPTGEPIGERRTEAPGEPISLASADIDQDGRADVASTRHEDGIAVMYGGSPGFLSGPDYLTPGSDFVAIADVNDDGFGDVLGSLLSNVHVFLNDGAGGFASPSAYPTLFPARQIVSGDVNNDGAIDLVVASNAVSASVLLGAGDGTFASPLPIEFENRQDDIAMADADGDGSLDVLSIANNTDFLRVVRGRGDGTFLPPIMMHLPGGYASLATGDFDGDGAIEVALADEGGGQVDILENSGGGIFTWVASYSVAEAITTVRAHDWDDDGVVDLVAGSVTHSRAWLFRGRGDGSFEETASLNIAQRPHDVAFGDVDGDGDDDLITASEDRGFLSVHHNQTVATIIPAPLQSFEVLFGTHLSGNIASLEESDSDTLDVQSQFGFSAMEPNLLEVLVSAETTDPAPLHLVLSTHSRLDNPGGRQELRVYNWTQGGFEKVSSVSLGSQERVVIVDSLFAEDRISRRGEIDMTVRASVVATFSAEGFEAYFDRIGVFTR